MWRGTCRPVAGQLINLGLQQAPAQPWLAWIIATHSFSSGCLPLSIALEGHRCYASRTDSNQLQQQQQPHHTLTSAIGTACSLLSQQLHALQELPATSRAAEVHRLFNIQHPGGSQQQGHAEPGSLAAVASSSPTLLLGACSLHEAVVLVAATAHLGVPLPWPLQQHVILKLQQLRWQLEGGSGTYHDDRQELQEATALARLPNPAGLASAAPTTLLQLIHSLAGCRGASLELWQGVGEAATALAPSMRPDQLTAILQTCGDAGFHHPALFQAAASQLLPRLAQLPFVCLASLAHAYATSRHYDPSLIAALGAEVTARLNTGSAATAAAKPGGRSPSGGKSNRRGLVASTLQGLGLGFGGSSLDPDVTAPITVELRDLIRLLHAYATLWPTMLAGAGGGGPMHHQQHQHHYYHHQQHQHQHLLQQQQAVHAMLAQLCTHQLMRLLDEAPSHPLVPAPGSTHQSSSTPPVSSSSSTSSSQPAAAAAAAAGLQTALHSLPDLAWSISELGLRHSSMVLDAIAELAVPYLAHADSARTGSSSADSASGSTGTRGLVSEPLVGPVALLTLLEAFARMGHRHPGFLAAAAGHLTRQLSMVGPEGRPASAAAAMAGAQLQQHAASADGLVAGMGGATAAATATGTAWQRCSVDQLCRAVSAFAALGALQPPLAAAASGWLLQWVGSSCNPQQQLGSARVVQLVRVVAEMAHAGVHHGGLYQMVSERAVREGLAGRPEGLGAAIQLAWSLAHMGDAHPALLQAVARSVLQHEAVVSMAQVSDALWAMAVAGEVDAGDGPASQLYNLVSSAMAEDLDTEQGYVAQLCQAHMMLVLSWGPEQRERLHQVPAAWFNTLTYAWQRHLRREEATPAAAARRVARDGVIKALRRMRLSATPDPKVWIDEFQLPLDLVVEVGSMAVGVMVDDSSRLVSPAAVVGGSSSSSNSTNSTNGGATAGSAAGSSTEVTGSSRNNRNGSGKGWPPPPSAATERRLLGYWRLHDQLLTKAGYMVARLDLDAWQALQGQQAQTRYLRQLLRMP